MPSPSFCPAALVVPCTPQKQSGLRRTPESVGGSAPRAKDPLALPLCDRSVSNNIQLPKEATRWLDDSPTFSGCVGSPSLTWIARTFNESSIHFPADRRAWFRFLFPILVCR